MRAPAYLYDSRGDAVTRRLLRPPAHLCIPFAFGNVDIAWVDRHRSRALLARERSSRVAAFAPTASNRELPIVPVFGERRRMIFEINQALHAPPARSCCFFRHAALQMGVGRRCLQSLIARGITG